VGSVMDRTASGQVYPEYFGFTCHSLTQVIAPQSSPSIIQDWYKRPINGRSNSGLGSTTAPQINNKKTFTETSKRPDF
jgi:hypothetical protein